MKAPMSSPSPACHIARSRELDRVGASSRKAGAADYIDVEDDKNTVRLVGPPQQHPRRHWTDQRWQLFGALVTLPDDAGVKAVGGR
jgi:hypothetical protein